MSLPLNIYWNLHIKIRNNTNLNLDLNLNVYSSIIKPKETTEVCTLYFLVFCFGHLNAVLVPDLTQMPTLSISFLQVTSNRNDRRLNFYRFSSDVTIHKEYALRSSHWTIDKECKPSKKWAPVFRFLFIKQITLVELAILHFYLWQTTKYTDQPH